MDSTLRNRHLSCAPGVEVTLAKVQTPKLRGTSQHEGLSEAENKWVEDGLKDA